ncbi:MAG: hypothetical protein KGS10_04355 [Chloroflexi bacterium]|nr:hypothetical protein [Chloroflexota bacterium]
MLPGVFFAGAAGGGLRVLDDVDIFPIGRPGTFTADLARREGYADVPKFRPQGGGAAIAVAAAVAANPGFRRGLGGYGADFFDVIVTFGEV